MKYPLLLALALAACAAPPTRWEKAGASETAMNEDVQACRVQARLSPQPHTPLGPLKGGTPVLDRLDDRDANEGQRIQQCMREKGYRLAR